MDHWPECIDICMTGGVSSIVNVLCNGGISTHLKPLLIIYILGLLYPRRCTNIKNNRENELKYTHINIYICKIMWRTILQS